MTKTINTRQQAVFKSLGIEYSRRAEWELADADMWEMADRITSLVLDHPFAFEDQEFGGLAEEDYTTGADCAERALEACEAIHVAHNRTWFDHDLTDEEWAKNWVAVYRFCIARWQDVKEQEYLEYADLSIAPFSEPQPVDLDPDDDTFLRLSDESDKAVLLHAIAVLDSAWDVSAVQGFVDSRPGAEYRRMSPAMGLRSMLRRMTEGENATAGGHDDDGPDDAEWAENELRGE